MKDNNISNLIINNGNGFMDYELTKEWY